jgi:hypothetical protein
LRILNLGIRNSIGTLTDDAFTQANPVAVATFPSTRLNTTLVGVLSGSVAFCRQDAGNNFVGGPGTNAIQGAYQADTLDEFYRPLGVFINSAAGNPYENIPALASGIGPYVSGMGTYGTALYETHVIASDGDPTAGRALVYTTGNELMASRNGFLMPKWNLNNAGAALVSFDEEEITAESFVKQADESATIIGVVKMAPDAFQTEVVWDQRL